MATYRITAPDGNKYDVSAPDNAKQEDVLAYAKINYTKAKGGPNWKGVVGQGVKEAFMQPGTVTRKLASDPVAQARALPALAGTAGGISPIPGGATLGTVGGRQLSNLALKTYGRPDLIPSKGEQVGEGALSAVGDIAAIPTIKKSYFGSKIGEAEKAYGLGNAVKEAPPSGMRTAVKFVQGLKGKEFTPQEAAQLKPAVDTIFQKGWLRGTQYEPDVVSVSQSIQKSLNTIPGRGGASAAMSKAMTIPRGINQAYNKIPGSIRRGLGYGTGVGLAGGASLELIKKLMGG